MDATLDRRPARLAVLPVLAIASGKLLIWLVTGARYGFHRDELYYIFGGHRFELGYVDHPPLVPWLAGIADSIFGSSLLGFRLLPALAGAALVFLAGALAAQLGGRAWAQALAAVAMLVCPIELLVDNLFQTTTFDPLIWAAACWVLLRLVGSEDSRWWLGFGVVAGIGLFTKYTIGVFALALVVAVVVARRRELAKPWIYAGGLIALAIAAPNLWWQIENGWPTLEFIRNNNARESFGPLPFLGLQLIFFGPFALSVVWNGGRELFSRPRLRLLGWLVAAVFGILLVLQSKPYYAASIYPLLFAAGAARLELRLRPEGGPARAWKPLWPFVLVLGNLLLAPVFLPILPSSTYARLHDRFPHPELGEMFGWPELVDQVGEAYRSLPEETRERVAILTSNYGSAAALDRWGASYGLPKASCGQNSYWYWSRDGEIDPAIVVGFRRETLERWFRDVRQLGEVSNRWGVNNEEAGRSFFLVSGAKLSRDELWRELRRFE